MPRRKAPPGSEPETVPAGTALVEEPRLVLDQEFLKNLVRDFNRAGCLLVLDGWELKITGRNVPLDLQEIVQREAIGLTWLWISWPGREACVICTGGAIEHYERLPYCSEHYWERVQHPELGRKRYQLRSLEKLLYRHEFGGEPVNPITVHLYKSRQLQYTALKQELTQLEASHATPAPELSPT